MRFINKTILLYFLLIIVAIADLIVANFISGNQLLLPFLVINFLFFLTVAFYDANLCLNILIFVLPFKEIILPYEIGIVTFDAFTAGIIALSFVYLIKLIFGAQFLKLTGTDIWIILFALFCLSFFVTSPHKIQSGHVYFHTVFIPFITYLLIRLLITDERKYRSLKLHFISSVTIFAVFLILNYLQTHARVYTLNINPLKGATFLIIAFFLTINFRKIKLTPILILHLFAFFVCFSRNLLVNLILSPIYYFILRRGYARGLVAFIAAATFLVTLGFSTLITYQDYSKVKSKITRHYTQKQRAKFETYQRMVNPDHLKASAYGLAWMWKCEMENFYSHPVFGVGIGNKSTEAASSHNLHIQLLSYTGLLGYILFHLFLFSAFGYKKSEIENYHLRGDYIFMCVTAVMIYLNGMTNGLFHGDFNYVFFIVLSLMQNLKSISGEAIT